jgi:hypothetical protein
MLCGADAFEISDIERMKIGTHQPGVLGRNNVLLKGMSGEKSAPLWLNADLFFSAVNPPV